MTFLELHSLDGNNIPFIQNLDTISHISPNANGHAIITRPGGDSIPVRESYNDLLIWLNRMKWVATLPDLKE